MSAATVLGACRLRDRSYAVIAAVAGAAALMFVNAIFYVRHYSDDAYISLRYARNLADGLGPVWNPGERVEGYTNFLWMAILAGIHKLGMDLVAASLVLAYLSMLATLLLCWKIWELWAGEAPALGRPAILAVSLLAIGLNDAVVFWGFSGLETPFAAMLLILAVYLWMRESRGQAIPWSALALSAAAMTRPEMVLVAGVGGAFTAWEAYDRRDAVAIRRLVLWVVFFAGTYGSYFLWRYTYYGYLFPNTFYAKVGSNADGLSRGIDYLRNFGVSYLFLPLIVGAAALSFEGTKLRRDSLHILAVVAVWAAAVAVEGGDAFPHGRFLAPLVPLLYLAGVSGLAALLTRAVPDPRQLATLALLGLALGGLALARASVDNGLDTDRRAMEERRLLGLWLHDNVPSDYTIGVYAAGAVSYYSQLPTLDMLGLTDKVIAHSDVPDFGRGLAGHEKYNIDYALNDVRPAIILLGDAAPFIETKDYLRGMEPGLVPGLNVLLQDDRTWEEYQVSAVLYSGNSWFNFLQRKDTIGKIKVDWTEGQSIDSVLQKRR